MRPSGQVSKYLHVQRSNQLGGLIAQLDLAAQLASQLFASDFIGMFYQRPSDEDAILVACNHTAGTEVSRLNLLDLNNGDCGGKLTRIDESSPDPFARHNQLTYRTVVRYTDSRRFTSTLIVYWASRPKVDLESLDVSVRLILEAVTGTMRIADTSHEVNDYSTRLTQILSVFEDGVTSATYSEATGVIARIAASLSHDGGACFLNRNQETASLEVGPIVCRHELESGTIEKWNRELNEQLTVDSVSTDDSDNVRLLELSSSLPAGISTVVAVELKVDNEHSGVLVLWTNRYNHFANNDLELISVLASMAEIVLRNSVHIEHIQKSKRALEKTSSRMADAEAMAALTDMTTGIAHEFNNVIGGIVGRVQLLKMKLDEGPILSGLNQVESLAMDGAETVRRIQEFTCRARNKKLGPVNLSAILSECVNERPSTWRELARKRKVRVVVCSDIPDHAYINGDADDLRTLFDKLIENGVEHSFEQSVVQLSLFSKGVEWQVTVTDHGEGINRDLHQKVFYPFFTTKTHRGAGLGLAIVYGIVVGHNGRIRIEEGPDGGAVFRVAFKSTDFAGEDTDTVSSERISDRLRILVVDDDEQIREILSDMLTIDGHLPTTCSDGYKALEAVDTQPFDLVITDLGMPGMSGLDLAAIVHEKYPRLPIAMITGWGTQIDEEGASINGIKVVLPKPFHLKDVKSLVRELAPR